MQRYISPIVNTALQHLTQSPNGIKTLMVMTGASAFVDHGYGVYFRFKGSREFNCCLLTYHQGSDTYTIKLGRSTTRDPGGWEQEWKQVHWSDLKPFFETTTGLCLSIPTVKSINA
tara:strand:- start:313 stop:660 length:348 start_codon:yes stop_codon:yes gene_type:complete